VQATWVRRFPAFTAEDLYWEAGLCSVRLRIIRAVQSGKAFV